MAMQETKSSTNSPSASGCLHYYWNTAPCLLLFLAAGTGIAMVLSRGQPFRSFLLGACFLTVALQLRRACLLLTAFLLLGGLRIHSVMQRLDGCGRRSPTVLNCRMQICQAFAENAKIREYQPDNLRVTALLLTADSPHAPQGPVPGPAGRVLLTMPFKRRDELKQLRQGQILTCRGVFRPLSDKESPDYDYSRFLRSTGIGGSFRILEMQSLSPGRSLKARLSRKIQAVREACAVRLLNHMPDGALESRMLLALALGYGNVLDQETRQSFIRAGTIHIFAISGLHVGLFFAMIYLFLQRCGLSMFFRRLAAGLLTALYVSLTGITPSSVRALGMALLLLYAQFRKRTPLPLNALGQIGLLSVLMNPYLLQNIGFLFSYTIVFFLLSSIPLMQYFQKILQEKRHWLPTGLHPQSRGVNLICSLLSCMTAWTAGLGITMHMNGIFCPCSPLVNFPLLPMIPVCLMLMPVKILLGCLWDTGEIYCSAVLSVIFKCMLLTSEWGGRLPGTILSGSQPTDSILLFYLGCVMLLFAQPGSLSVSSLFQETERSGGRQGPEE